MQIELDATVTEVKSIGASDIRLLVTCIYPLKGTGSVLHSLEVPYTKENCAAFHVGTKMKITLEL